MEILNYLKKHLETYEESKPIRIIRHEENESYHRFYISNLVPPYQGSQGTESNFIQKFFGFKGVRTSFFSDDHYKGTVIDVSKVDMPETVCPSWYASKVKELEQGQAILGLGEFGVETLNLEQMTHVLMSGAPGFGKSSFFKFMLGQILNREESIVNFIIDPKKVDYDVFNSHPRVARIAKTSSEWQTLLLLLVIEISVRQHLFNSAFEVPPTSMKEFNSYKEKFKRDDLPKLPKIILWIDEAHMVFKHNYNDPSNDFLDFIFRKGRSFGVHIIATSQSPGDFNKAANDNSKDQIAFYSPRNSACYLGFDSCLMKPVPGRLYYICSKTKKLKKVQTPMFDEELAIGLAYDLPNNPVKVKNSGLIALTLSREALENFKVGHHIINGGSLENFDIGTIGRVEYKSSPGEYLEKYHKVIRESEKEIKNNEDNFSDNEELNKLVKEIMAS